MVTKSLCSKQHANFCRASDTPSIRSQRALKRSLVRGAGEGSGDKGHHSLIEQAIQESIAMATPTSSTKSCRKTTVTPGKDVKPSKEERKNVAKQLFSP